VRDELVRRFMPFARKLALRYLHSREPLDDLVWVASLGLLNAVERFEPGRGGSFTAYAAPTILRELTRHFRDKGWSLHVPRDLKERALAATRHTERLCAELGRSPTVAELADALRCTIEQAIATTVTRNPSTLPCPTPVARAAKVRRPRSREIAAEVRDDSTDEIASDAPSSEGRDVVSSRWSALV
jgi:RNA polymerase sigma-B factor